MAQIAGKVFRVVGPVVEIEDVKNLRMLDMVEVGEQHLIGEVVRLKQDRAFIQVYEDTTSVKAGDLVYTEGLALYVELGPGLIGTIYDGIQRPLNVIRENAGDRITRGITVDSLDHEKLWSFKPVAKVGDVLTGGGVPGAAPETGEEAHRGVVPPRVSGKLIWVFVGEGNTVTPISKLETPGGEVIEFPML